MTHNNMRMCKKIYFTNIPGSIGCSPSKTIVKYQIESEQKTDM